MILKILPIITLLVSYSLQSISQHFPIHRVVFLDSLSKVGEVCSYTLNTKELYGAKRSINLFNVMPADGQEILLFSVLPSSGHLQENWEKVNLDSIRDKVLSVYDIKAFIDKKSDPEYKWQNSLNWAIVKKEFGEFYISKNCLTELFTISNHKPSAVDPNRTINTQAATTTMREIRQKEPDAFESMDPRGDYKFLQANSNLRGFYFSRKIKIASMDAYQFWTFADWNAVDSWNINRGIDRFVYIPGKGIVGGSYDFWFKFRPAMVEDNDVFVSGERLWNNMLEEKVMLAEKLKK